MSTTMIQKSAKMNSRRPMCTT